MYLVYSQNKKHRKLEKNMTICVFYKKKSGFNKIMKFY